MEQVCRRFNTTTLALLAILVIGALVRIWDIGGRDLWLDEAFSAVYAQVPLEALVELRREGTNPPLYHLVLRAWVWAFGTGEIALRMMSVVAGVAAVGLAYPLARRFGDRRTALIACALLAVNNWAICYSQEARFYALVEALAILTTLLLHDALATRHPVRLVGYVLAAAAFAWVHTCAWFVLLAQAIWVALRLRAMTAHQRRQFGPWLGLAGIMVVVLFLPWSSILLDQVRGVSASYWIPAPRWFDVGLWVQGMVAPWTPWRWAFVGACAGTAVVVMFLRRRRARCPVPPPSARPSDRLYLLLWLLLPVVIPVVWSLVGTPVFRPKYALVSQPAALLLLAGLIIRRPVVCSVLLAVFVLILPPSTRYPLVREDWRATARLIETRAAPDARIFVYPDSCYFPLRYYLDPQRSIIPVFHPEKRTSRFADLYTPSGVQIADLLRAVDSPDEIWIVLSHLGHGASSVERDALVKALCPTDQACQHFALNRVEVLQTGSGIAVRDEAPSGAE